MNLAINDDIIIGTPDGDAPKVTTGYIPRIIQFDLHRKLRRFNVVLAHRRLGKTVWALNHLINEALTCKKNMPRFAYLAPTYGQAKRVAWDYLKMFTDKIPGVQYNEADLRCDFPNGARITLLSAENPMSLKGLYLDSVVLDEYGDMNPTAWREVIRPTLSDRNGTAIFIGTVKGTNHFWDMYLYARDQQDPEWFSAVFKASETNIIDAKELASARKTMTEEEYNQEFECFVPGTLISTPRGQIPIDQLRVGDSVLTHRNRWRPVLDTMSRHYTGVLISIYSTGHRKPLLCTPEHPFLVYDKTTQSREWKTAVDLTTDDYLLTPKFTSGPPIVSKDWVELLAWFICEGSVNGNSVCFSLNDKKPEKQDVFNLLSRLGYPSEWASGSWHVCSVSLADFLTTACGSLAPNKRIPFDLISGHGEFFFQTLIRGDGCFITTSQGGRRYDYTTVSKGLANDLVILCATLSRRAHIGVKPAGKEIILGREVNCREKYQVRINNGVKVNHAKKRDAFPAKLGVAYRVMEIEHVPYDGLVHNIEVKEDNSYVAECRAVHNCDPLAGLVGAYFGKDLAKAEKENRITTVRHDPMLPVHTFWDLGMNDLMAVWFVQTYRTEHRFIDYFEASGMSIPDVVKEIGKKPYKINSYVLPHDAQVRDLSSGRTRVQTFYSLGCRSVRIVPRVGQKMESINAARMIFPRCLFDRVACAPGLKALSNYQRKWDGKNNVFQETPLHNWASNGADAYQTFAMGSREERDDAEFNTHKRDRRGRLVAETEYDLFGRND